MSEHHCLFTAGNRRYRTDQRVSCDYTLQKLLERDLIRITGRADTPGKPLRYSTTQFFMDYFGINALDELPKLKVRTKTSHRRPRHIIVSAEE